MTAALSSLMELVQQGVETACIGPTGEIQCRPSPPPALLPGSFNPLHEGHLRLADAAAEQIGAPVSFELSRVNVDKPPLEIEEIQRRLRQFVGKAALWLTCAPTFLQKAELFPNTIFVVGADTAERIVAIRYYQDEARRDAALEHIRGRGCRFLVAGRRYRAGRFICLDDLPIPSKHRDLFTAIPADRFRLDLSSTELRSGK